MEDYGYIDDLAEKLSAYFDIEKDWALGDIRCDLYAKSFIKNEKYFLTKKAKVYSYENHEHCLIKYFDRLGLEDLDIFLDDLKVVTDRLVIPHREHMSSIVTGVMVVAKEPGADVIEGVKGFKYHKSFAFGFKGWVDIRLILVNPPKSDVITNKKGKEVACFYAPR